MHRSKSYGLTSFVASRRRALGQHLLVSGLIAQKIIKYSGMDRTDVIFEIGTGKGFLTERLAEVARNVISFEIDEQFFEIAKARLSKLENVKIELCDAFLIPYSEGFDLCISSLPYSRSIDFLEWIAKRRDMFRRAVFLIQKEFADKLVAIPGSRNYRAVSVICQASFIIEVLETVTRNAFDPPPTVLSSIVRLSPRTGSSLNSDQIALIKNLFSFRGRTVRPALKKLGLLDNTSERLFEGILTSRVEKLSPDDFLRIASLSAGRQAT